MKYTTICTYAEFTPSLQVKNIEPELTETGIDMDSVRTLHYFSCDLFSENTFDDDIRSGIACLAVGDRVDFVRYENGNYGFVTEYDGCENGFEIL